MQLKLNLLTIILLVTFAAASPAPVTPKVTKVTERSAEAAQLTCPIINSDGPVNVRTCPSTSCSLYTTVSATANVVFTCYTTGTTVFGNQYWDKTGNGHYISEYYVGGSCPYSLPPC